MTEKTQKQINAVYKSIDLIQQELEIVLLKLELIEDYLNGEEEENHD